MCDYKLYFRQSVLQPWILIVIVVVHNRVVLMKVLWMDNYYTILCPTHSLLFIPCTILLCALL